MRRLSMASPLHHRMLGARLTRCLPGAQSPSVGLETSPHGLFLVWLAYAGALCFGAWVLWRTGMWWRLAEADPTRLTLLIVLIFAGCTVWVGRRAWVLSLQWQALQTQDAEGWAARSLQRSSALPMGERLQLLSEWAHGPHEMAWWINGTLLKLGLLGKVIGFSVLALQLGQLQQFDPSQAGQVLSQLTGGLGIALLTTITGLSANMLLGLQLMRLDRFADTLVATALAQAGEHHGHRQTGA